jgi:hypothetical protein
MAACDAPACSVAAIRADAPNGDALTGLTLRCDGERGDVRAVRLAATGLDHAVYVGGIDRVTVTGCVAEQAAHEGPLVDDSHGVRLTHDEILLTDRSERGQPRHRQPVRGQPEVRW